MCTAAAYRTDGLYFGRNLDYEMSYGEQIAVIPRNYPFNFRVFGSDCRHYAMIGTAHAADGYPLFYDAANEKGLCMAGLNFVNGASYAEGSGSASAPYEFIPLVLAKCSSVAEARELLDKIVLGNIPFSEQLPAAKLHWIIADKDETIVAEPENGRLKIYDAPVNVLTNDPPFNFQMHMLNNYMALSPKPPKNMFSDKLPLKSYSRGMGAMGLPGDLSSESRFVKTAFTLANSVSESGAEAGICQLFHILGAAEQQNGCCELENGKFEKTIYTACFDASRGVYYYTTYENRQITAVDMYREALDGDTPVFYPMLNIQSIKIQNL